MLEILLADDHELVRTGLRLVLETIPGWHVCGEAADGAEAVAIASRCRPPIAIIDLNMPVKHGLDAIREIRQVSPATAIVALTADDSGSASQDARFAGARSFVLKTEQSSTLVAAVRVLVEADSGGAGGRDARSRRDAASSSHAVPRRRVGEAHRARAPGGAAPGGGKVELGRGTDPRDQHEDGRDAPGEHHAEARARLGRGAGPLRRSQPARRAVTEAISPSSFGGRGRASGWRVRAGRRIDPFSRVHGTMPGEEKSVSDE